MPTYETFTSIAAPQEAVWRVLSDVAAWPSWLPTVAKVEPLDGEVLRLGARFLVHQPKLRPATWTVIELEEPRRFVWVAQSPGCKMLAEHTVDKEWSDVSRVVLRFSFTGPLGSLLGWLFRSAAENYIGQEAFALKKKVEALRWMR